MPHGRCTVCMLGERLPTCVDAGAIRTACRPEGADAAGHDAAGDGFNQYLCTDMQGFSLHTAVRCDAADRKGLEQLCRQITRSALANERVQCNATGQGVLKLRTAGATAPRTW